MIIDFSKYSLKAIDFAGRDTSTKIGTFAGLYIAPAPLYYGANGFEIKDEDWNHESFDAIYGKNIGSYYFNFTELGSYFDSDGLNFSTTSGDIDNTNKISDWRLPTRSEWRQILCSDYRPGATVNGTTNCVFALVQLTNETFAGEASPEGLLLFPDNLRVNGKTLSGFNNRSATPNAITLEELGVYLNQGCTFIPSTGYYYSYNQSWTNYGNSIISWTATESDSDNAWDLNLHTYNSTGSDPKTTYYFQVRLVKEVIPTQTHTYENFAGLNICPMPIYYGKHGLEVKDITWYSSGYEYGLRDGSTFFSFVELGAYFNDNPSFDILSGSIDNTLRFSYGGHYDWRLPTKNEWSKIFTTSSNVRSGSTVNGTANVHYASVRLQKQILSNPAPFGALIFPDNKTITGKTLRTYDLSSIDVFNYTSLEESELNEYLSQGCVFLPAWGYIHNYNLSELGNYVISWSATEYNRDKAYDLNLLRGTDNIGNDNKEFFKFRTYLVRDI